MPLNWETRGWEDKAGDAHRGDPHANNEPLDNVFGLFIHFYGTQDGQEIDEWKWMRSIMEFDTWDEWYAFVDDMADMYGLELA